MNTQFKNNIVKQSQKKSYGMTDLKEEKRANDEQLHMTKMFICALWVSALVQIQNLFNHHYIFYLVMADIFYS